MVTINNASLHQDIFETIYDDLKAKATSSSYGTNTQPTVTAAYVDSDEALPEVVIHSPVIDKPKYNFMQSQPDMDINTIIDIFAKSNKNKEILTDNVNTFIEDLNITGVSLISNSESEATPLSNENKIRLKTITFTYKRK